MATASQTVMCPTKQYGSVDRFATVRDFTIEVSATVVPAQWLLTSERCDGRVLTSRPTRSQKIARVPFETRLSRQMLDGPRKVRPPQPDAGGRLAALMRSLTMASHP